MTTTEDDAEEETDIMARVETSVSGASAKTSMMGINDLKTGNDGIGNNRKMMVSRHISRYRSSWHDLYLTSQPIYPT